MSCGTYGFVGLHTLNGCLIVSVHFQLLYLFMQHRGSAPNVVDKVMACLYVTCPGLGISRFI